MLRHLVMHHLGGRLWTWPSRQLSRIQPALLPIVHHPADLAVNVSRMTTSSNRRDDHCLAFDHITFIVGNAKQAAAHYCVHYGFQPFAYKGLETGSRSVAAHVVKLNDIVLEFTSPLRPEASPLSEHLVRHGDAVKVVAFEVQHIERIVELATQRGGTIVQDVEEEVDERGSVKTALVRPFGDTVHKLIDRSAFEGHFLPGYREPELKLDALLSYLPPVNLHSIDHLVGCQPDNQMEPVVSWYEQMLNFTRFWSVDDSQIHTEYSALRTTVVANGAESIKVVLVEPAPGKRKSQVLEFVEFFGGSGVQHIALRTEDIISAVQVLQSRGVEFLKTPPIYYRKIRQRLQESGTKVAEDLATLEQLNILVDFDENGYILQIFTKPLQDRPTHFLEIIQRRNHNGFGAGNIKTLFEAVEYEQKRRGNLH